MLHAMHFSEGWLLFWLCFNWYIHEQRHLCNCNIRIQIPSLTNPVKIREPSLLPSLFLVMIDDTANIAQPIQQTPSNREKFRSASMTLSQNKPVGSAGDRREINCRASNYLVLWLLSMHVGALSGACMMQYWTSIWDQSMPFATQKQQRPISPWCLYICAPKVYCEALNAPVVVVAVESPTRSAAIYWSVFIVFWDDTGGCWSVSIARLSPGMCCYIATIPPILEIWCHIQFCC